MNPPPLDSCHPRRDPGPAEDFEDFEDDPEQAADPAAMLGLDQGKVARAAAAWLADLSVRLGDPRNFRGGDQLHPNVLLDPQGVDLPATVNGLPGYDPEVRAAVMAYGWTWLGFYGQITTPVGQRPPDISTLTDLGHLDFTIGFLGRAGEALRKGEVIANNPLQAAADGEL